MALSKQQQVAVQTTFARIESNPDPFATLFYQHLFERDQSLKKLFKTDLKQQGDVLVRMLTIAVSGLDHPDDLLPALHDLGLHHAGYGVKRGDYETFGSVLMQTLAEFLGTDFNPDVAVAWNVFYHMLAAGALAGADE